MKCFLFDIGGVLVDYEPRDFLDEISKGSGGLVEELSEQDLQKIVEVETGAISDDEYVEYLNRIRGLDWRVDDLVELWSSMFVLNETGFGLFKTALEAGVPVYMLSNIAQHHVDAIERNWTGFFGGTTGFFMSYEMGVRKPDQAIYQRALDHLGVAGTQCFFIDDRPENIAAAREAGITAHHFTSENHAAIKKAAMEFFGLG